MTFPTIHLNGSNGQNLVDAIDLAMASVQAAMRDLAETAPNARDFYVQKDPNAFVKARAEHEARMGFMVEICRQLGAIAANIDEQLRARSRRSR